MKIDIEKAIRFEDGWDLRLGGERTRAYRELLGYAAARLMIGYDCGAEDVQQYLRELIEQFGKSGGLERGLLS